jgi:hypothetical protein
MATRCKTNRCSHPRANWWKSSLGVNWFDQDGSGGGEEPNAVHYEDGTVAKYEDNSNVLYES